MGRCHLRCELTKYGRNANLPPNPPSESNLLYLYIQDIKMDFDPQKNYYEILGVGEDASADEIKKVFRKAAVKHHPDR